MYNAIADQLRLSHPQQDLNYRELRKICSEYMKKNMLEFLPFLINKQGDCLSEGIL